MTYVDPALQPDVRSMSFKWWIGLVVVLFVLAAMMMVAILFLQTTSNELSQSDVVTATGTEIISELPVDQLVSPQVIDQQRTGYNEYADQQSITAQYYPEPPAPTNVEVHNTAIGNSVIIEWTLPEQQVVDAIEIYRTSQENAEPTLLATVDSTLTFYNDDTVKVNSTYWYSVRATRTIDAQAYYSGDTDAISVVVQDVLPPAPPYINSIAVKTDDPLVIEVMWSMSELSDVHTFKVYRSKQPGQLGTVVADVDASVAQLTDPTVEPGSTYYYTVTAIDDAGNESATRLQQAAPGNSQPFNIIP